MYPFYSMFTSFVYGLAFFTLGVEILLYPRRGSQFKLAEDLGFIALFGMFHGGNEWMEMFKLVHPNEPAAVKIAKLVLLVGSFFFLVLFGTKTIVSIKGKNPFVRLLPVALLAAWALLTLLSGRKFLDGDVFARYILGFPGTLLAAYALYLHIPEVTKQNQMKAVLSLKVAAAAFIVYGFFSGLVVPGTGFFPASVFNYAVFFEKTGVHVQWLRTLCAVSLFFTIIPVLKIFERETVNSLREARDQLEDKVRERTAALHNANEQLLKGIEEIRRAQGALRESEERLVLAQRAGHVGVFDWDLASGKVIWTEQGENMPGLQRDFEGDYEDWTKSVHPEDVQRLKVFFRQWIESGADEEYWEYRLFQPDGRMRWIEARGRLMSGPSKRPLRIIGVGVDVTDRKQAAEQISELNEELKRNVSQLQAANRELEAFTYSVSHDLRAPLRHMAGFVELLNKRAKEGLDEKSRHYLQVISGASSQMGQLVDDLLAFSRAGRVEIKWDKVDSGIIVKEAIANLESDTGGRDIVWKIGVLPGVFGDAALLRQVWVNLISNAVKFTRPRGQAIIEIGVEDAGEEFVFHIKDNGVGFDMRYKDKLFGLFQRLHRTEEFEGTGVGLANVQRIVHRHGGRAWGESVLGEGATFYFSLPKGRYAEKWS